MATDKVQDDRKPGWFWADNDLIRVYGKRIGMNGVAVYCALLTYAQRESDGTGDCFPSISTLAKTLGSTEPTIRKTLEKLEKAGLITATQRLSQEPGKPNQSNLYHILPIGDMYPGKNSLPPTQKTIPSDPDTGKNSLPPLVKDFAHDGKNSLDELDPVNKNHINKSSSAKRAATKPAKATNPNSNHPAVTVYRDIMGRFPNATNMGTIVERVGDTPGSLADWEKALRYWAGHENWNQANVNGMLDCFEKKTYRQKVVPGPGNGGYRQREPYRPASFDEPSHVLNDEDFKILALWG